MWVTVAEATEAPTGVQELEGAPEVAEAAVMEVHTAAPEAGGGGARAPAVTLGAVEMKKGVAGRADDATSRVTAAEGIMVAHTGTPTEGAA